MKFKITHIQTDVENGCFLGNALKLFLNKTYTLSELIELGVEINPDNFPENISFCDKKGCCHLQIKRIE